MKDLDKEVIYDLRDLNEDEFKKVSDWLLKNDKNWNERNLDALKKSPYLRFHGGEFIFHWKSENMINAKTLFAPKVNIINPTKS